MTSNEIRELFLSFFAARDHKRLASASLIPAAYDPSVMLTTAGMHPLKAYFLGQEEPPALRLTSCQKCFRTPDIEQVGKTARHLTFFEMLGNFSIGDYFKTQAVEFAWQLSLEGFGFDPQDIWITVFEGDDALGLGPDEEAIAAWESVGVPRERIVLCPRSENFWQAGPVGPCGPCSELYLDRGLDYGKEDDLPGGENERFLEYWNLVFMQSMQDEEGRLHPLPKQNIDTGLGLNRLAAILQNKPSVFETDQFQPLIELGETLSGRNYGEDEGTTKALRILADHARGMTFLIADGVVPSNEDRGYVLRRLMRRAIQQGRTLGLNTGFLNTFADCVEELMAPTYPELHEQRDTIRRWLQAEEETFSRTLEQGTRLLDELIQQANEQGRKEIPAADAFQLHDTFGFPFELTKELLAQVGLTVQDKQFETLMQQQRQKARAAVKLHESKDSIPRFPGTHTTFTGYEKLEQVSTIIASEQVGSHLYVKLAESPFYATGGGQVADHGTLTGKDQQLRATVGDVIRQGDEQVLRVELHEGTIRSGMVVHACVDAALRRAIMANHTATHLLQAALREVLGSHVRQAGSAVRPDKLRFDFTHTEALGQQQLMAVEDRVNEWVMEDLPVRATVTTLKQAKELSATALFGEKYGDRVRMVEVGDGSYSRELCGGTHVHSTAQIGLFTLLSESSSAANVRRIEACTGSVALKQAREEHQLIKTLTEILKVPPSEFVDRVEATLAKTVKLEKMAAAAAVDVNALLGQVEDLQGVKVLIAEVPPSDADTLRKAVSTIREKLDGVVVVLASVVDEKVLLFTAVSQQLISQGLKAGEIVRVAAKEIGGGGGGKDTFAQAGGRNPERLSDALGVARKLILETLEKNA